MSAARVSWNHLNVTAMHWQRVRLFTLLGDPTDGGHASSFITFPNLCLFGYVGAALVTFVNSSHGGALFPAAALIIWIRPPVVVVARVEAPIYPRLMASLTYATHSVK